MDKKEILEKAIQKAIDGGWTTVGRNYWYVCEVCEKENETLNTFRRDRAGVKYEFNKHCGSHGNKLVRREVQNHWFVSNGAIGGGLSFHVSYPNMRNLKDGVRSTGLSIPIYELIFNHDFAKAIWRESMNTDKTFVKLDTPQKNGREYLLNVKPNWKYHLQQMVIAEDPLKYLGDNLPQ